MSSAISEQGQAAAESAQSTMRVVNPLVEGMVPGGNPLLHGALPRFNHAVTTGLVMVTPVYAYTVYQVLKATQAHVAKSGGHLSAAHWRQLLTHASSVLSKQRFAPTVAFFTMLHMLDYAWRSRLGLGQGALYAAQLQTAVLHRVGKDAANSQAATLSAFGSQPSAAAAGSSSEHSTGAPSPAGGSREIQDVWDALRIMLDRSHADPIRQSIESAWAALSGEGSALRQWQRSCSHPRVPCPSMRQASKDEAQYAHPAALHLGRALPLVPFADVAVPLVAQAAELASATAEAAAAGGGGGPDFAAQWPSTNLKSLSPPKDLLATCADSAAAVRGWSVGANPVPYAAAAELLASMPWYDTMLKAACSRDALAQLPLGASIALTVQPLLGGGCAWAVSTPLDSMLQQPERLALRAARARVLLMAQHRLQAGARFADSATALMAEHSIEGAAPEVAASHRDVCAWSDRLFMEDRVDAMQDVLHAASQTVALESIARALLLKAGLAPPDSVTPPSSTMASCPPWELASRPVDKDGDPVVFRLPLLALQPDQVVRSIAGTTSTFAAAFTSGGYLLQLPSVLQQLAWAGEGGEEAAPEEQAPAIEGEAAVAGVDASPPQAGSAVPINALDVELVDVRPLEAQEMATALPAAAPAQDTKEQSDIQHMLGIYRAVAFAAEFAQQEQRVQLLNGQAAHEHAAAISTARKLAETTQHAFATHSSSQQADISPISWESASSWTGSPMGIVSAASDLLRRPEWEAVRASIAQHTHALRMPPMQAAAAFATNALPVGVEPRDAQRLLPYLQFSSLGGLMGGAAGAATAVLFKKQTMAWTQATPFRRHVTIAAAAGAVLGAFTSSYEESSRPLASVFNGLQQ